MKKGIIVFTRVPVQGQTKTRMMPFLSPQQCEELHTAFLQDIAKQVEKMDADLYVFYTPEQPGILKEIFGDKATYRLQQGEGLGNKMFHAIKVVLEAGYDRCILMGTDVPQMKEEDMNHAFDSLEDNDLVFAPTMDGGYFLIGMKQPIKEAFEVTSYGHGTVMEETLQQLEQAGYCVGMLQKQIDIDTREDLMEYIRMAREDVTMRESYTGRYVMRLPKISIIIPTYNEEKTIGRLMEQLKPLKEKCQILFVDGGSSDRTLEILGDEFTIITGAKGRANQMNLGAEKSSGDILFFLHCDSILPKNPLQEIYQVMEKHQVGCFGIGFHSRNFFMWTCRVISNHRAKYRRIMFGDQGIFIDRKLFYEIGKFPAIPIMEDYQFSRILKKSGIRPGMTVHRIFTSDRRYPKGTIRKLRVMWMMYDLRRRYRAGESIEKIAQEYRDIR